MWALAIGLLMLAELAEPPASKAPTIDLLFCHFPVSAQVKNANASFYIAYSFQVDEAGKAKKIKRLREDSLDEATVADCLGQWRLSSLKAGSELTLISYWKHGVGWTRMSLSGGGLALRIQPWGEAHPYRVANCYEEERQ